MAKGKHARKKQRKSEPVWRVPASHTTPNGSAEVWNSKEARAAVIEWATADDGDVDFSKLRQACLYFDADRAGDVRAYRGIHHRVKAGELVVDQRRVGILEAKLADLWGKTVPEAVKDAAEAHLEHHRRSRSAKADARPPCLNCGYTAPAEIEACPLCGAVPPKASSDHGFVVWAPLPAEAAEAWESARQGVSRILGGEELQGDGSPHVTLLYLGQVPAERQAEAVEVARQVLSGSQQVTMKPLGIGTFEPTDNSEGRTPVFVDFGDAGADINLALLRALAPFVEAKQFPEFHAHATLGYIDRELADAELAALEMATPPGKAWPLETVQIRNGDADVASVALSLAKGIPIALFDLCRPKALAKVDDDAGVAKLHDEIHRTWISENDDAGHGGWANAHTMIVQELARRGTVHPAAPAGTEDLDGLAAVLSKRVNRQAPRTVDPSSPAAGAELGSPDPVPVPAVPRGFSGIKVAKGMQIQRIWKAGLADADDVWRGLVYEPWTLDAHDQWMSADTIRRMARLWLMRHQGFNEEHKRALPTREVFVSMSWIPDVDYTGADGEEYKADAWYVEVKLFGDTLERAKSGDFTGYSLEGDGFLVDHREMNYDALG